MDALGKWPNSTNPREVGYSIALGKPGETSVYEEVTKDPARAVNFGRAMQFFSSGEGYEVTSLVDDYPCAKLGNGIVVDVRHPKRRSSILKFSGWWGKWVCKRRNLSSISNSETGRARHPH